MLTEPVTSCDPIQVAAESKMTVDVEEYVGSFRTDLCDVLAAWSRGSTFAEIMKMTDVFEVSCQAVDFLMPLPTSSRFLQDLLMLHETLIVDCGTWPSPHRNLQMLWFKLLCLMGHSGLP